MRVPQSGGQQGATCCPSFCDNPLRGDEMTTGNECPRCGERQMRSWSELSEDEREVVKRLPASADYSLEERQTRHRWCTRCWYEATDGSDTLS